WDIDLANINTLMGAPRFAVDKEKSKITGELSRVYKMDGQQWGVIEIKARIAIAPSGKGESMTGTVNADVTIDTAIDGSVHAGTIKMTVTGNTTLTDPKGNETKVLIEGIQELTGTPVK